MQSAEAKLAAERAHINNLRRQYQAEMEQLPTSTKGMRSCTEGPGAECALM